MSEDVYIDGLKLQKADCHERGEGHAFGFNSLKCCICGYEKLVERKSNITATEILESEKKLAADLQAAMCEVIKPFLTSLAAIADRIYQNQLLYGLPSIGELNKIADEEIKKALKK